MEIIQEEYEQYTKWKTANGSPVLCHGLDCEFQKVCIKKIWSWSHFWIGLIENLKKLILSPHVWVFLIVTINYSLFADKANLGQWIAYVSLGGAFMFYEPLSSLIGKGNLNINGNIGASLNKEIRS